MAEYFTKIEDLFQQFRNNQSIGGSSENVNTTVEGNDGTQYLRIFQPDRGVDVTIKNVNNIYKDEDDFTTGLAEESGSRDFRKQLGTITLNNRDYWENVNFNDKNFTPYLSEPRLIMETYPIIDGNEDEIITNNTRLNSATFQYSIDAVPFVINPNDNEIIRLDRYYDKEIQPEKHELASEGKINYYLYPRKSGRTEKENIDT